jgi:hypothetical protein
MKNTLTILLLFIVSTIANAQEIGLYKSVNLLQPNRKNELFISLPNNVNWEKVILKTESGEIVKSNQKGKIALTPNKNIQRKIEHFIEVYEGKKLLQQIPFAVPFSVVRVTPTNDKIYVDCKNSMKVEVLEGNSRNDNVSIEVENASWAKFNKKIGYASIIPKAGNSEIHIKVFADSDLIATETLKVSLMPKPEMKIYFGNYPVDLKEGIYLNYSRDEPLNIKFTIDSFFAEKMALETNYELEEGVITLARGNRALVEIKMTTSSVALSKLLDRAESGDRLVVQPKRAIRTNSVGTKIEMKQIDGNIYTIPLK